MIRISDILYYDETKSFIGQEQAVQDFLINRTQTEIQDEIINEGDVKTTYARPLYYKWVDKNFDYVLSKEFIYRYNSEAPEAGLVDHYEYSVEDNTWFEPLNHWQVKQDFLKCFQMMEEVPALAIYRQEHDIIMYKRNGMIYFYVRFFEPGYVELLNYYSCVITENLNYEEVI